MILSFITGLFHALLQSSDRNKRMTKAGQKSNHHKRSTGPKKVKVCESSLVQQLGQLVAAMGKEELKTERILPRLLVKEKDKKRRW